MRKMKKCLGQLLCLGMALCMVIGILPVQALAETKTDYSIPVPMLPVDSVDISNYNISLSYQINGSDISYPLNNNTISYNGEQIIIDPYLKKDSALVDRGVFYTLEVEGDNVRKELVKDSYNDTLYFGDMGSQAVFGFVLRFEDFNKRAGLKRNNLDILYILYLKMQSEYTLDELKQYSCAREFLDKTGFYKSDERVEAGSQGYVSPWEDTITPRAKGLGYNSVEAYMDDLVIKSGYDGWYISDDKEYTSYVAVKKSAISKEKITDWTKKLNVPLFEKGEEYYVRSVLFNKPTTNTGFYAMQTRERMVNDLGLNRKDTRIETREDPQKNYHMYCNCTYTQLVEAWAQEMDTWSGHWDYLLHGDTNFDYWPNSDISIDAGYKHGNYGSMGAICGAVPVKVDPEYRYYIDGPGDVTIRVTGKNINYANIGETYNITGTSETVVHVVGDANHNKPVCPFQDVFPKDYYYKPVLWAVNKGITNGVSKTLFAPENSCTREQMVTFLWRAAGCPKPKTTYNPFIDVEKNYAYNAVIWAVEEGITKGVSDNLFAPNSICTREQMVTFLWRVKKCPEPKTTENPFNDVDDSSDYYKPILWAMENKITSGVGDGKFSPKDRCTRGQMVTFLYRTFK